VRGANDPSAIAQLYAAPHILWSREWAYGQRSASKDDYVLYPCYVFGIVNTDFGEGPFHALR
jgi:hypothetical protein